MTDFTIKRVTDPKEGPIDGVSAETVGVYTKFRGRKVSDNGLRFFEETF